MAEALAGVKQQEEDFAAYCTPSYVEMEIGASLLLLGRTKDALSVFEASRTDWSDPKQARDNALCLARLATAHGDFLPIATDTFIARAISQAIAENYPVFMLPPITISCSHEHSSWPGTVSISARTLHTMVTEIYESVTRNGPSALILINGHGGNYVLSNVVQEASATGKSMALFPAKDDWLTCREYAHLKTPMHEDMHAGEIETSILLHTSPELVSDGYREADHVANDRRHMLTLGLVDTQLAASLAALPWQRQTKVS